MKRAKTFIQQNPTHAAGWGSVALAVIFAAVSFPSIAAKTQTARATTAPESVKPLTLDFAQLSRQSQGLTQILAEDFLAEDVARPIVAATLIDQADHHQREHHCLSEAVFYEARSEGKYGQRAVAEVVQNRVRSKHYPNSICGVVYQGAERKTGCQFSFTCDGSLGTVPKGKTWRRAQAVATLAMTGGLTPMTGGATHYHNLNVKPAWSDTLVMTKQIETHKFYRTRWRERGVTSAALTVAPPSP